MSNKSESEIFGGDVSREGFLDYLCWAADICPAGKVAAINGYDDLGKRSADILKNAGCRVVVTEIDPINALQATMNGHEAVTMDEAVSTADIFVATTGRSDMITIDHLQAMKDRSVICNVGGNSSEIQVNALTTCTWRNIGPQATEAEFPNGKRLTFLVSISRDHSR